MRTQVFFQACVEVRVLILGSVVLEKDFIFIIITLYWYFISLTDMSAVATERGRGVMETNSLHRMWARKRRLRSFIWNCVSIRILLLIGIRHHRSVTFDCLLRCQSLVGWFISWHVLFYVNMIDKTIYVSVVLIFCMWHVARQSRLLNKGLSVVEQLCEFGVVVTLVLIDWVFLPHQVVRWCRI